jgi:hypothetical protein
MKTRIFISLISILFSVTSIQVLGQSIAIDSLKVGQKVVAKMKNGDEFKGVIKNKSDSIIVINTMNGALHLNVTNVKSIDNDDYFGKFRFPNVYDTRYFFGPSGFQLKKNKGYYQNILLTSNFVHYGITNNISIGGGFEFASLIVGYPIWFISPKVGFEISKNVHAAGGVFIAGISTEGTAALGYGVVTLGSNESNITFGAGYGYMSGAMSKKPALMLNGTHRVGNGIALLSENYFIPNSSSGFDFLGIEGIRLLFPKNSFDFGLIVAPYASSFILPIPYIGFSKHF